MKDLEIVDLSEWCPRCGLPWDDHPWSERLQDHVCVQVEELPEGSP